MVVFSLLTVVIFSFAFDPEQQVVRELLPGMIWVMIIFSGLLGLNRTFREELRTGSITGLKLVPVDRSAIYLGKVLFNFGSLLFVELISVPVFLILFGFRVAGSSLVFALTIVLASLGFSTIGTLLAALSASSRSGDL